MKGTTREEIANRLHVTRQTISKWEKIEVDGDKFMSKILIIEDEKILCDELSKLLKNAGYDTICVTDFSDVAQQMESAQADLILLDINLPVVNGETLLQDFHRNSDIPVIMLTSRTTELDEVLSMSFGADDYITKPYNPTILLLRISAVLKRSANISSVCSYRDIQVSPAKGSLIRGNSKQILTKNEMIIFQQLLDRQGEIVTRDELMTVLWDNDEFVNDNALSVNISRLRGKLSELGLPDVIETRKKQGYILI
jgi:DNA-binding response OmpR family regulator